MLRLFLSFRAPDFFAKSLPLSVSLGLTCTALALRYRACPGIRRSRSRLYHGSGHTAYSRAHLRLAKESHRSATVSGPPWSRTLVIADNMSCYSTDSIIDILVLYAVSTGQCYRIPYRSDAEGILIYHRVVELVWSRYSAPHATFTPHAFTDDV